MSNTERERNEGAVRVGQLAGMLIIAAVTVATITAYVVGVAWCVVQLSR